MPSAASACASVSALYCGWRRDQASFRTSTTHCTACCCSSAQNSAYGRVECPMVKTGGSSVCSGVVRSGMAPWCRSLIGCVVRAVNTEKQTRRCGRARCRHGLRCRRACAAVRASALAGTSARTGVQQEGSAQRGSAGNRWVNAAARRQRCGGWRCPPESMNRGRAPGQTLPPAAAPAAPAGHGRWRWPPARWPLLRPGCGC